MRGTLVVAIAALALSAGLGAARPVALQPKADRLDIVATITPPSAMPVREKHFAEDVCGIIEAEAMRQGIPNAFFARLIWKESLFDPGAVSPKGAEGIAQFMPGTAELRGLDDAFAPHKALPASAHFLADLKREFGNLGLAAAAYNAGSGTVAAWLARKSRLPFETQDYVQFITGRPAEDWVPREAAHDIPAIGKGVNFLADCLRLVTRQTAPPAIAPVERAPWKPWGVVVSGGFSESRALLAFRTIKSRYPSVLSGTKPLVVRKRNAMGRRKLVNVMIGKDSRGEADSLCARLQSAGGACMVLANTK